MSNTSDEPPPLQPDPNAGAATAAAAAATPVAAPEAPVVFAAAAPALREDQLQQALSFLQHPKVKGSPVAMKRSFLERKGLTEAEITEAFRRVPEEAPAALAVAQPSSQVPGLVTYAPAMQAQQPQQQLVAVAPSQALVAQPQYQPPAPPPPPQPLRWTQVALGVSVVAASAYTIRHLLFPYAYSMYEAWNGAAQKKEADRRRAEEEAREAKEALLNMQKELSAAAACLAEAVEMMREQSQTSDMLQREQQSGSTNVLNDVRDALSRLNATNAKTSMQPQQSPVPAWAGANGTHSSSYPDYNYSGGYGGDPYSGTIIPQPPGGYLGGASSKAQAPGLQGQGSTASSTVSLQKGGDPTYPTSFHEVMEMVSKGITPPNVRTDIRDTPPDPSRPPSEAQISQRTKPWLQPQYGTTSPSSAFTSTATVDPVVMSGIPSPYLYSSFAGARSAAGPSGSAAPPQMPTASSARDLEQGVTRPAHTVQTGQQLGGASHLPFIPPQGSESAIGVGPTSGLPQISTGYPRSTSVGLGPQSGYEGPGTPGSSASSQPAFHPPSGHSPPMTGMAQLPPSGPSPPMMGMPPPPQQQQQPHLGGGLVDLADSQWGRLSASEPTTMSPSASVSAAGPMGSDGPTGAVTGAGPSGAGSSTLATPLVTSVARTPLTSMLPAGGHVGWRPPPLPQPTVVNQAKPAEARPQSSQANPAEVSPPPIPEPTIVNQAKPAEARPQSSQVNPAEVSPQSSQANPAEVSPPPIPEPTMINQAKPAEASPQSSQANPAEVSPPPIPEPTMVNQAKPAEASPQSSQAKPADASPPPPPPPPPATASAQAPDETPQTLPSETSAVPEPIALSPVQKAGTSKAEFTTGAAGPSTSPGEASQPGAEEAGQVATE